MTYSHYHVPFIIAPVITQAYVNYALVLYSWVLFQSWASNQHFMLVLWCLLSTFRFWYGQSLHSWGQTIWVCTTASLWNIQITSISASWCWFLALKEVHWVAAPPTSSSQGLPYATQTTIPWTISSNSVGHTTLASQQKATWSLCLPYMAGRDLLMMQSSLNLLWVLNLVSGGHQVSGHWIYLQLVSGTFCCLITNLLLAHGQGVIFSPLAAWTRLHGLYIFDKTVEEFSMVKVPSSKILSKQQNWMHPLTSLMVSLFQSSSEILHKVTTFVITLNYSMLLASYLINYGGRLEHYLSLYNSWEKY